jgi:hypothetical protein
MMEQPTHNPAESFELNGVPGPVVIAEKEGQEIEDVRQGSVREIRGALYRGVSHGVRLPNSGERSSPPINSEEEAACFLKQGFPWEEVRRSYGYSVEAMRYITKKYNIRAPKSEPEPKPESGPEPEPKASGRKRLKPETLDRVRVLLMDLTLSYDDIGTRVGVNGMAVRYHATKWGLTSLRQNRHEALPEPKLTQVVVPQPQPAPAPAIEPEAEPMPVVDPGPEPDPLAVYVPLGIVIEDNVPLPDRYRWQFLNDMQPGQSAFVPESFAGMDAVRRRIYGDRVKASKFACRGRCKRAALRPV